MTARSLAMTAVMLLGMTRAAAAGVDPSAPATHPPATRAPQHRAAADRAHAGGSGAKSAPHAAATHAKHAARTTSATAPSHTAASRTLEDIHIEGEIPVPQILFITARDQRRFMEFQSRRYLRSAREVGDSAALPSRIVVTSDRPAQDKEIAR